MILLSGIIERLSLSFLYLESHLQFPNILKLRLLQHFFIIISLPQTLPNCITGNWNTYSRALTHWCSISSVALLLRPFIITVIKPNSYFTSWVSAMSSKSETLFWYQDQTLDLESQNFWNSRILSCGWFL